MTRKTFHARALHTEATEHHLLVGLADHGTEPSDYLVVMRGLAAGEGIPTEIVSSVYLEFGGETMAGQGCITRAVLGRGRLELHVDRKRCKQLPYSGFEMTFDPEAATQARLGEILRAMMPDQTLLHIED